VESEDWEVFFAETDIREGGMSHFGPGTTFAISGVSYCVYCHSQHYHRSVRVRVRVRVSVLLLHRYSIQIVAITEF